MLDSRAARGQQPEKVGLERDPPGPTRVRGSAQLQAGSNSLFVKHVNKAMWLKLKLTGAQTPSASVCLNPSLLQH